MPQITHSSVIIQRQIASPKDMQDVEAEITRHLGGENYRCAFLRSRDYILLRIAALYAPKAQDYTHTARTQGLAVTLQSDHKGKTVTVHSTLHADYTDLLAAPCDDRENAPDARDGCPADPPEGRARRRAM